VVQQHAVATLGRAVAHDKSASDRYDVPWARDDALYPPIGRRPRARLDTSRPIKGRGRLNVRRTVEQNDIADLRSRSAIRVDINRYVLPDL
jgi:hypothetical protein